MGGWLWMMDWEGRGRRRSQRIFRYYPNICLERMGKIMKVISYDSWPPGWRFYRELSKVYCYTKLYNVRQTFWRWKQRGPPKRWYPTTSQPRTTSTTVWKPQMSEAESFFIFIVSVCPSAHARSVARGQFFITCSNRKCKWGCLRVGAVKRFYFPF
jgi:hypothetical protein